MINRPLALLLVAVAAAAPGRVQQPTFSTRSELVRVDALVLEGSRPVTGLAAADFELLDDGVPQKIDLATFEKLPVDLVLALDVSASVQGERLERLIEASQGMMDGLQPGDEIALLTFNNGLSLRTSLGGTRNRVRAVLSAMKGSGLTSLRDAVHAGLLVASAGAGRPLLVVFSDGRDTASWLTERDVAQAAKRSNTVVYAVTVGQGGGAFLRDVTRTTGGNVFEASSNTELRAIFVKAVQEFKSRYLLGYEPKGVPGDGWHRLDVRVRGRSVTIKARAGYCRKTP